MSSMARNRRPLAVALALLGRLGLGLTTIASGLAQAQTPSFEATAAVPLAGPEELVRARAQALSDALGRALEQAVAQVAPESRSRVYLILGRARDYIASYRVLDEGQQAGQFQVRVAVELDLPRLLRDLQATPRPSSAAGGVPVVVCSPSTGFAAQAAVAAARTLLDQRIGATESLAAVACAERLQQQATGANPASPLLILQPDANLRSEPIRGTQPPRVGAVAQAEWLFYPQAPAAAAGPLRESGQATIFLDSAESAQSEAQRQAALAGIQRLLERPGLLGRVAAGVRLRIEGVGSYANYQQLLRTLGALPGVGRVEPRRFLLPPPAGPAAFEEPQVEVLLHTATAAESIGAALGRTPLTGLRLQVAPLGTGELRIICVPESLLPSSSSAAESLPEGRSADSEGEHSP